ncbi:MULTISPECIES: hypothetical protein [Haloarcula]|uniref:hypothetical protein n=1 Tax=Haloarcula TaxID=2237 RepID=UPI0023E8E54A|nr:hypothetical protein [Halomicroarcula sp. SHR3]
MQVDFYQGSTRGEFTVRVVYHARSTSEAEAATNGTFDPVWLDGEERLERILAENGADPSTLTDG